MNLLLFVNEEDLAQRIDIQKARSVAAEKTAENGDVHHSTDFDPRDTGSAALCEREVRRA